MPALRKYKHLAWNGGNTPMYALWKNIMHRCYNPKLKHYPNYGGRGICVYKKWHDFDCFVDDIEESIGSHPGKGWTLDRIKNDEDYKPGNVQWATNATNCQHRRSSKLTMELANQIRKKYASGKYFQKELASIYNVDQGLISAIILRKKWI